MNLRPSIIRKRIADAIVSLPFGWKQSDSVPELFPEVDKNQARDKGFSVVMGDISYADNQILRRGRSVYVFSSVEIKYSLLINPSAFETLKSVDAAMDAEEHITQAIMDVSRQLGLTVFPGTITRNPDSEGKYMIGSLDFEIRYTFTL